MRGPVRRFIPGVLRENLVFRRVWSGQTISLFGDQISLIAIPLTAVLVLDANAKQMGYLVAAELAPNLFFALHAGAWVDRRGHRRRTMIFTDLARAALLVTIPLAYAFGALTIQQLYVVAFLVGTMTRLLLRRLLVALRRARRAGRLRRGELAAGRQPRVLVRRRAEHRRHPRAAAQGAVRAARRLGLVPRSRPRFLASIEPVEPETEEAEKGHVVAGVRYLVTSPVMRSSLLATATINLFNFVFHALFILYAVRFPARAARRRSGSFSGPARSAG